MKKLLRHQDSINIPEKVSAESLYIEDYITDIKEADAIALQRFSVYKLAPFISLYAEDIQTGGHNKALFRESIRYYIQLYQDVSLAVFHMAMNPDTANSYELFGQSISFPPQGKIEEGINTGDWIGAFNMCLLSRNSDALHQLLAIPESVMRQSNIKGDNYRFLYIDFLKSMYADADLAKQKLMETYKATDPEELKTENPFYALHLTVPELELYAALLSNQKEEFNEKLYEALRLFRELIKYTKTEKRPGYLIAHNITAIAALAYDNHFPIEVESEYMPRFLVEGNF